MRKESFVIELVVLTIVALWLIACSSAEVSTEGSSKLEDFVAQTIIDEHYDCPECIVAYVAAPETQGKPFSPIRIWRYSHGRLKDENPDALDRALGDDRSEWPLNTFVFMIDSVTSTRAIVCVQTFYNMGIMEGSRGGNEWVWELEKQSDVWVVIKKSPTAFWD